MLQGFEVCQTLTTGRVLLVGYLFLNLAIKNY